jgi:hypothetical protein
LQVSLAERVSVLKDVVLNFANRRCFADLASKLVVVTIAVGQLKISDHFTGYPATPRDPKAPHPRKAVRRCRTDEGTPQGPFPYPTYQG